LILARFEVLHQLRCFDLAAVDALHQKFITLIVKFDWLALLLGYLCFKAVRHKTSFFIWLRVNVAACINGG